MTRILSGTLFVLALLTGRATAEDAFSLADRIIRAHHLLTPKQIACVTYTEREDSTEAVAKVGVYERHDEVCGGDPEIAHRLFDLEIDRRTGAAQWDFNFPDMEMRPVPDCVDCATTAEGEPRGTEPVRPVPPQSAR